MSTTESDPEKTSEAAVRFLEAGPGRARVELEHRHLDRHATGLVERPPGIRRGAGLAGRR